VLRPDQPAGLDRGTPPPAQAPRGQQVHPRRRLHRDGGRRPERAHRLPLGRGPGVVLPAGRRDGAAGAGKPRGWPRLAARDPDPRRRGVHAAAAGAAFAAAHGRRCRPGGGAQAPGARARRPAVVLRALQPQAVRGILPAAGHRARLPPGVRAFLRLARQAHLRPVRPRASAARRRAAPGRGGGPMSDIAAQVRELDAADPLRGFRDEFLIPPHGGGEQHYFVGNSLGLQPRAARAHVLEVLDKWAAEAVEGHFNGDTAWMDYHRLVRDPLARLVGALPEEVVAMNTLTVNLHLMLASFYCPDARRSVVLMEAGAFPSDRHAVESQIRLHGLDPAQCLVEVEADQPDGTLSDEAIARAIAAHGPRLALVLWPGIQYRTGQAFDLARIAALAHAQGARAGFDLAHAVGNLPL